MWNIFIGIILSCLGILAIAFTLFVLIGLIYTIIKQAKKS